jgi:hypothetical protein
VYSPLRSIQVFQQLGSAWIPLEKDSLFWSPANRVPPAAIFAGPNAVYELPSPLVNLL